MSKFVSESSINPASYKDITSQIISRIEQDFSSLLHTYNDLFSEESTSQTHYDLQSLNQSLYQLKQVLEPLIIEPLQPESLDEDQQTLIHLHEQLNVMIQGLLRLNDNMKLIKNITSKLAQDAKDHEKVIIEDVMMIDESKWTVKVRSPSNITGNFRNIRIVYIRTNQEVCRISLIEPSSEVKVFADVPLIPGDYLQAIIGEKTVSNYFSIPNIKILKVIAKEKDRFEFFLKNFTKDYIEGAVVEYNGVAVCENINLEPFQTESFVSNADIEECDYFAVRHRGKIVSQPVVHPNQAMDFPDDVRVSEFNDRVVALEQEVWSYGDQRDELTLKYLILTKKAKRYEDIAYLG